MSDVCTIAQGESVSACQQSLQYFQEAVTAEQTKREASLQVWTSYRSAYTMWQNAYSAWQTAYGSFKQKWEAGRTLTGSYIWDGNATADCTAVPKATYKDAMGWVTYTRNCNDIPNSAAAKCQSCGYWRCDCTAGLDQWCKTSRCAEYRYNSNYSTFPGPGPKTWPVAEASWLSLNPAPKAPTPPDSTRYPDYTNIPWPSFPNIICQSCSQCMSFDNLAANTIDINQLQQSCINKLTVPPTTPTPDSSPLPPTTYTPAPYTPPTTYTPTPYTPPTTYTPTPYPPSPKPYTPAPVPYTPAPVQTDDSSSVKIMIIVGLFILLIIIGLLAYFMMAGSSQPEYQPPGQMYPQYTSI